MITSGFRQLILVISGVLPLNMGTSRKERMGK
jgi:hypothetical protein